MIHKKGCPKNCTIKDCPYSHECECDICRSTSEELIDEFNVFIKKWCGENASHLLDSDDNDGEKFRKIISKSLYS